MIKKDFKALIGTLEKLDTEQPNVATGDLDTLSALEIVQRINDEDRKTPEIVARALPEIARAAEAAAAALKAGGRLIYVGAGTSGRLGVLDAAECPPTFGSDPKQVIGLISGGFDALVLSKEGVEDNAAQAVSDIAKLKLKPRDFVVGITASRRTPYTISALQEAAKSGSKTALIICNSPEEIEISPDIVIALPVGAEVVTGSTRMKSGTVTKMALNMISTAAMVLQGKTYGNLMVDLQATSDKLSARSRKILMSVVGVEYDAADKLLREAGGSVKVALVMGLLKIEKSEAERRLKAADGFVRGAIE
ncbi:MAG TPA: N-acetylmuramic acid 6-phosphate etherase [candidate division Zixibacteria bacterium]|nr:N-acetylmuramic acid 6-phosphate etherase [candidate division Zixibacteria bacterium]